MWITDGRISCFGLPWTRRLMGRGQCRRQWCHLHHWWSAGQLQRIGTVGWNYQISGPKMIRRANLFSQRARQCRHRSSGHIPTDNPIIFFSAPAYTPELSLENYHSKRITRGSNLFGLGNKGAIPRSCHYALFYWGYLTQLWAVATTNK